MALALLGLMAGGAASLAQAAARLSREAERLDQALMIGETLLARLSLVSFTRLPEFFGASSSAGAARLDTDDSSAPAEWSALAAGLPAPRVTATLQGLTTGGGGCSFGRALALRVRVRVEWSEAERRRRVELTDVRF